MHTWCNTHTHVYSFQKSTSTSTSITYVIIVPYFWFVQTILSELNFPLCHLHQERGRASVFLRLKCMGVALRGPGRELIKSSGWFSPPLHMAASWSRPPFRLDSHREGQTCTQVDKHAYRSAWQRLRKNASAANANVLKQSICGAASICMSLYRFKVHAELASREGGI